MEANSRSSSGLSIHAWVTLLVPDNTPFDQFMDANPDSLMTFGEASEPVLGLDLLNCSVTDQTGGVQPCFTELGNFKRDPGVNRQDRLQSDERLTAQVGASRRHARTAGSVDPLLGIDMFLGSNLSLKNPNFRSFRCGECHAGRDLYRPYR